MTAETKQQHPLLQGAYFDAKPLWCVEQLASQLWLTKSTKSGRTEPFALLPHAKRFIANLLGWKRADGRRLYTKAYSSMARKQAKTQNMALLALALLLFDDEAQPEIYIAAADRDQAARCYEAARDMVNSNDDLAQRIGVIDSRKTLIDRQTGGIIKALSSEGKTKHGYNPSVVIFDELHCWGAAEQELYDALTTGSGARRQPLQLMITTAGTDQQSLCYREYEYAKRVLTGQIVDPTYLPDIYELPMDADWTDESLWHIPNPALGRIVDIQFLREERDKALARPAEQNKFRRLYMNQWTNSAEQWIPLIDWDRCANLETELRPDAPCFGGLDLGATRDLTAFALAQPGEKWRVKVWQFLPEMDLKERCRRDNVPYDVWAEQGHIILTPGNVTDWVFVTDWIAKELAPKYRIHEIGFDRAGARDTVTRLRENNLTCEDFGQGFLSMSPACKRFEELVFGGKLEHDGNPLLRWNIDCSTTESDAAGNIKLVKPDRKSNSKRIDGAVAAVMAIGTAMKAIPFESVYEKRGVLTT